MLSQQPVEAEPPMPIVPAVASLQHVEMAGDLAEQDYVAGYGSDFAQPRVGGIAS